MSSSPVERYVHELSRGYRTRRLLSDAARLSIAGGIVVTCTALVWPGHFLAALWIGTGLVGACVAARFLALRLDPVEADQRLDLRGRLRTWFEVRAARGEAPMLGWLERELAERLEALPPEERRQVGRRGLGAARSALVLLVILLLLRLLVLPPLPDGVLSLAGRSGSAGAAAAGDEPDEGQPEAGPEAGEPEQRPPDSPAPDDGPQPDSPQPEGPELPPEALVFDPPVQDAFVVPSFVGAGDGRETTAPAAGIDEGPAGRQGAAGGAAGGGAGGDTTEPPAARVEFERALEDALRSRHVPAEERAFVRRWFRSLLEERR